MSATWAPTIEAESAVAEEAPRRRQWTRAEYYRAAETGIFRPDERLELIKGEIYQKVSPQNRPHIAAIIKGQRALQAAFGEGFHIQPQGPMQIDDESEPEPDLLVVPGDPEDYEDHPTYAEAALVVEVAESTLRFDRGKKAALYAEAGVMDYWVVSTTERRLYVMRDPAAMPESPWGFGYRSVTAYLETESAAPLRAPGASVSVADLLPKKRATGRQG